MLLTPLTSTEDDTDVLSRVVLAGWQEGETVLVTGTRVGHHELVRHRHLGVVWGNTLVKNIIIIIIIVITSPPPTV